MNAITIWQPWATLLACKVKKYETRSWGTSYRGPIAIHAAVLNPFKAIKPVSNEAVIEMRNALKEIGILTPDTDFRVLPRGCVIATAELINCWRIVYHPGTNIDVAKHIPIGAELDVPKHHPDFEKYIVPTEQEMMFGDWTPGRFAWEFSNMTMLLTPIPAKGFWV